jgi:hypothetical protein
MLEGREPAGREEILQAMKAIHAEQCEADEQAIQPDHQEVSFLETLKRGIWLPRE